MKVQQCAYIAGPMRGFPFFGFPLFDAAQSVLEDCGWTIISPAQLDREIGFDTTGMTGFDLGDFDLAAAFRRDIESILKADAVILLPGWENSTGANLEKEIAEKIGVQVLTYEQAVTNHA